MAKKKASNQQEEPLEKQLWKAADKLRKNIDAAEYKHVVLGLIFLKYTADSFEEMFQRVTSGEGDYAGADPEDKDEYKAENVFFVPLEARWSFLLSQAKQPTIGKSVDDAMDAIEKENPILKGVLPKVFARQNLAPTSLGELFDLVGNIAMGDAKGAFTSKTSGEGEIRKAMIADGNLIDCIVNLPSKLFLNTQIPAALWFLNRARKNGHPRKGEILFIDARNLGHLINRRTKEISPDDVRQISSTYHASRTGEGEYQDIKGFCASVPVARVAELDYVLTPGRYVGLPDEEDDFNFSERFLALKAEFESQLVEEAQLNQAIAENLAKVKLPKCKQ